MDSRRVGKRLRKGHPEDPARRKISGDIRDPGPRIPGPGPRSRSRSWKERVHGNRLGGRPGKPSGGEHLGEVLPAGHPGGKGSQETEQPEVSGSGAGRPIEGMPSMTPEPAPAGAP
ncbi:hypothetical protein GCM10022252_52170 [Streptosporangium oxazolinicum]|uniref:Uncharacterized protein n=1 Tax=Streptosporangium oxazolinicum TaxID=909287 RepID=A0ABP8B764_9ACTN